VYGAEGVKVFTVSPGFVVSGLGPHNTAGMRIVSLRIHLLRGERHALDIF
jgi:hypothetical protein